MDKPIRWTIGPTRRRQMIQSRWTFVDAPQPLEALDMIQATNDAMSRRVDPTRRDTRKKSGPQDLFIDTDFEDLDDPGPAQSAHRFVTAPEEEQSEH